MPGNTVSQIARTFEVTVRRPSVAIEARLENTTAGTSAANATTGGHEDEFKFHLVLTNSGNAVAKDVTLRRVFDTNAWPDLASATISGPVEDAILSSIML